MAEVPSFDKLFIGGEWVEPAGSRPLRGRLALHRGGHRVRAGRAPTDVDRAVAAARAAFDEGPWPRMSAAERADAMQRLLDLIYENAERARRADHRARSARPLLFSHLGQVGATGMVLDYFVGLTRTYAFEEVRQGFMGPALVRKRAGRRRRGGIIPWNVPLFITMLKLGPTLASGSHHRAQARPRDARSTRMRARRGRRARPACPPGVVNIVPADREVGEHLVRHPDVDKVELHRLDRRRPQDRRALRRAAQARAPSSSAASRPRSSCDDADLASRRARARCRPAIMNNGQACVAQTRILAPRARYDEVVDALAEADAELRSSATRPTRTTAVGPLVAERQRDRVEGYIAKGRDEGARDRRRRRPPGRPRPRAGSSSRRCSPTSTTTMTIAQEEIFGPVLVGDPLRRRGRRHRASPTTATTACPARCGPPTSTHGIDVARQVRTGTYTVNGFAHGFGARSAASRARASAASSAPRASQAFLEDKTINLPGRHRAHARY